jgi:hypothetical protein
LAGDVTACWTEVFVEDGIMVGRGVMAAVCSSGTDVVTAERSVVSWTDTVAETVALAAVPLTDPEAASVLTGLAATPSPLTAGTACVAGAVTTSWTETFVRDGVMVRQDAMVDALSSGTAVVTDDRSVVSWTDAVVETAAICL